MFNQLLLLEILIGCTNIKHTPADLSAGELRTN